MTTRNQAREAMYQAFVAAWSDRTPFCLDNEPFDPPAAPWVRVSVRHHDRAQATLGQPGSRKFESHGMLFIQYFEPPLSGQFDADGHVSAAQIIFDAVRIEGTTIRFEAAKSRELGIIEEGRWSAALVECNFVYDEQR